MMNYVSTGYNIISGKGQIDTAKVVKHEDFKLVILCLIARKCHKSTRRVLSLNICIAPGYWHLTTTKITKTGHQTDSFLGKVASVQVYVIFRKHTARTSFSGNLSESYQDHFSYIILYFLYCGAVKDLSEIYKITI
jgi:hypothetical protein